MPDPSSQALITAALTSGSALLGVLAGGLLQFVLAERAASRLTRERREDALRSEAGEFAKLTETRAWPSFLVARHLEAFARSCADTVAAEGSPDDERQGFPVFAPWPDLDWTQLSSHQATRAQDFQTQVSLHEGRLRGDIEFGADDERDADAFAARTAARAGLEAWKIAKFVRSEAALPDFRFPEDTWDFPDTLKRKVEEDGRLRAKLQARPSEAL